jgi:hypothetical protein
MTITRNILLGLLALQLVAATSAYADPTCLVGKWQVQTESIAVDAGSPSSARMGEWSVSGDLTIEIDSSGAARFAYDNYVVLRKTSRGGFEAMLEVIYNGVSEGRLSGGDDPNTISLRPGNKIPTAMRQKMGGQSWVTVSEDEERPPHGVRNITFECTSDELILTKSNEGPFGGEYRGHFQRS